MSPPGRSPSLRVPSTERSFQATNRATSAKMTVGKSISGIRSKSSQALPRRAPLAPISRRWTGFWLGGNARARVLVRRAHPCALELEWLHASTGSITRMGRAAWEAIMLSASRGAGAWGMALANAAAAAGRDVVLWGRDSEAMAALGATRLSQKLPGVRLTERVVVTADLGALAGCSGDSGRDARSSDPRRGPAPRRASRIGAVGGLRQGRRARLARLHDAGACSSRAGPPGCDPLLVPRSPPTSPPVCRPR